MKPKDEFNAVMIQEMGLEVDLSGNLVDQDTGVKLEFKGKSIKVNDTIGKDDIAFETIENPNLMNALFNYYIDKINKEDDRYIGVYYQTTREKGEKGCIEVKEGDNIIKSDMFYNDSIKYGDLILKLNNSNTNINLQELDQAPNKKK